MEMAVEQTRSVKREIGKRIAEEEQQGAARAEHGKHL